MRMKKFEILEHTADLKIKAFGKDKKKLFLNMLKAMAASQKAELKSKEEIKRKIKIKSLDLRALLIDFLSEVLYLSQVHKEVYNDVNFTQFTDAGLEAELTGQRVKRFGEDIKAVTHHDLDIHQGKDGLWQATVLFDI